MPHALYYPVQPHVHFYQYVPLFFLFAVVLWFVYVFVSLPAPVPHSHAHLQHEHRHGHGIMRLHDYAPNHPLLSRRFPPNHDNDNDHNNTNNKNTAALIRVAHDSSRSNSSSFTSPRPPTTTHIFYYPWYASKHVDGKWLHWNHEILPHWQAHINSQYKNIGQRHIVYDDKDALHDADCDLGASFFPQLGPYSSADSAVISQHYEWLTRRAGINVIIASWWGRTNDTAHSADGQGYVTNHRFPQLFRLAEQRHSAPYLPEDAIYIAFHLEPYPGRTIESMRDDIEYIVDTYGSSPAFYRTTKRPLSTQQQQQQNTHEDNEKERKPMFYVYDSYHIKQDQWSRLLSPQGDLTIRNTKYDGIFISLYVDEPSKSLVLNGKFDGFFTYFATDGFTPGSSLVTWPALNDWANKNSLLFIPSVGPGYDDISIRPWNMMNSRGRERGAYYDRMWQAALNVNTVFVSVTSFNEWHEGSQIEPAIAKKTSTREYLDYEQDGGPEAYLDRTMKWVSKQAAG